MIKWLKKKNSYIENNLYIKQNDKGNGLYSNNKISENKTIIEIPLNMMITSDMGKETVYYNDILTNNGNNITNIKLLVFALLKEINNINSKYKFYLKLLPNNLSHIPLFWNNSDLLYIKNTFLFNEIINRKKNLNDEYTYLYKNSPNFRKDCVKLDDYYFIRSLVGSRNFNINVNNKQLNVLVPLSDMLNHSNDKSVEWGYNNFKKVFYMKSIKEILVNTEITDSYGKKSNIYYLLYYGFCLKNNNYNLKININYIHNISNDKFWIYKKKFISKHIDFKLDSSLDYKKMLIYFRIICVKKKKTLITNNNLYYPSNILDYYNKYKTILLIKKILKKKKKK